MDPAQYYATTLTAAFKNLAPVVIFIIGGWFIFIKLPFFFFLKGMRAQKQEFDIQDNANRLSDRERDYKLEDYQDFQRRMKIASTPKEEPKKEETKKEQPKQKAEQKSEQKKAPPKKEKPKDVSAEEIFHLKPGEVFTKSELKRKYHDLLKMNHPDKVGQDQKKSAEFQTKEINSAYVKLKSKAA